MLGLLRRLWAWLVRLFRPPQLTHSQIVTAYISAGATYGDACTYPGGMAEIGGRNAREVWAILEKEYAALGYRTIPIKNLIKLGGYGEAVTELAWVKRDPGEVALLWEPNTEGPIPMPSDVLDRLATIGEPRTCPECKGSLLKEERVHCSWCLWTIYRSSFKSPLALFIADDYAKPPAPSA